METEQCVKFAKTPETHWDFSVVFSLNCEQISHIVLMFPWMTEQVNADWDMNNLFLILLSLLLT